MRTCGLDECGRGAFAGPLVAAGVVLAKKIKLLRDSKNLNPKQRWKMYRRILKNSLGVEVEIISARQINNRGMGWANKEIFKRLGTKIAADVYIADGNLKLGKRIESIVKADTKIAEVKAASIVAKFTRDKLMKELHKEFPRYGWKTNKGYGTKFHQSAIDKYGATKYHRSVWVTTAQRNRELSA